jgi:hypothetical protein
MKNAEHSILFCGTNCLEVDVTDQQKLRDTLATSTRPQSSLSCGTHSTARSRKPMKNVEHSILSAENV